MAWGWPVVSDERAFFDARRHRNQCRCKVDELRAVRESTLAELAAADAASRYAEHEDEVPHAERRAAAARIAHDSATHDLHVAQAAFEEADRHLRAVGHEVSVRPQARAALANPDPVFAAPPVRHVVAIEAWFAWMSLMLPPRVVNEVIGDGMELLDRHEKAGATKYQLWLGAAFLTFWALIESVKTLWSTPYPRSMK